VIELLRRTAGNRVWQIVHPELLDEVNIAPDLADELELKWRTARGQLWEIGPHRIVCDDCTNEAAVQRLFEIRKLPSCRTITTDAPYGVSYAAKNQFLNAIDRGNRVQKPIENDDDPLVAPAIFSAALRLATRYSVRGATCYATVPGGPLLEDFIGAFNQSGFSFKSLLVWAKNQFVLGRSDYQFQHENILYGWIENGSHYFVDDRTQSSIFAIDKPHVSASHPTQKPIELFERMIANSSRPGELVYDPFTGSGTSIIAAHRLGRVGYGCEIDPGYLAVILERFSILGLQPELVQ
jgi:DNA modification methylase